ncbi:MAG: hypothetical protein GXY83_24350 [Rhodopirellula sp.]|nr:hypothetical protein [Rhodopirellula sp.]
MKKPKSKKKPAGPALAPGDRVVILQNPHDPRAEEIVGTVMVFRPGAGFAGADLADVHYRHPRDGRGVTLPFGLSLLAEPTPDLLIQLAERHERQAAALRAALTVD